MHKSDRRFDQTPFDTIRQLSLATSLQARTCTHAFARLGTGVPNMRLKTPWGRHSPDDSTMQGSALATGFQPHGERAQGPINHSAPAQTGTNSLSAID
jgi:hypothetical protein